MDFVENLSVNKAERNYATPIPQLISTGNAIMNEYCIMKQETQSSRFFEMDTERYLDRMALELDLMVDSKTRAETERLLTAHGWSHPRGSGRLRSLVRTVISRHFLNTLLNSLEQDSGRPFKERLWLFLARHFGVKLPDDHRFPFSTVEQAKKFMFHCPRRRTRRHGENIEILQATEVPAL